MNVLLGALFFFVGQIVGWFSMNSQFISDWWKDKPIAAAVLMGIPTSICFWYAYKIIMESTGSAWTARFIGSSMGLIVFPMLTWFLLGESMFTAKTMLCFFLAILIILIQLFY
tara:strand:+ start:65 stop:403 length:339 start_codon:yes stop_codon:yes gene_type:complete